MRKIALLAAAAFTLVLAAPAPSSAAPANGAAIKHAADSVGNTENAWHRRWHRPGRHWRPRYSYRRYYRPYYRPYAYYRPYRPYAYYRPRPVWPFFPFY